METSRDRPPVDDDESTERTETMSGVGVPAGDGTIEGLGYDGEHEAPRTEREDRPDRPAGDEPTADTP